MNVIAHGISLIITRYVFHITMKIVHIGIKQVTNDVLGFEIWVGNEMEILVAIAFFFEFVGKVGRPWSQPPFTTQRPPLP